jgi:hypothetical protein
MSEPDAVQTLRRIGERVRCLCCGTTFESHRKYEEHLKE